jgi:hypothetical protein
LTEFVPEHTGSYLISFPKPSGVIRGIAPVDIWRRDTRPVIVQGTQHITTKTCIDSYPNFNHLTLSKDGASHCLYFLNTAYSDTILTSSEDDEDPWVIMRLDFSNVFDQDWYWMFCPGSPREIMQVALK